MNRSNRAAQPFFHVSGKPQGEFGPGMAVQRSHRVVQALALAQGAVEFFARRIRPIGPLRPVLLPRAPGLPPVGS